MLPEPASTPVAEASLSGFFAERLTNCARHLRPQPQEDTLWYLGALLERFGRSDALFAIEEGQPTLRPLALLYGDAREAESERERCLLLRHLGDLALFLGALFPQTYERRGIRRDYFVGMGSGAYDYLGDNAQRNRHIFTELAATFSLMLDLVARSCDRTEQLGPKEVVSLYQRWVRDRDPAAERQLRALGIDLDEGAAKH